jgi:hypothetical protein
MKCSEHGDIENWEDHPECLVCEHLLKMYHDYEHRVIDG